MAKDKGKKADKNAKKAKKADKKDKAARKAEKKAVKDGGKGVAYRLVTPSLTVNDLAASLKFYQSLGFAVKETWKAPDGAIRGYELEAGKTGLMIGQDDFAKGKDRKKGEGVRLYFQTKETVDDVAARIKAAGVALASEPADQAWGGRTFDVVDPDGYKYTVTSTW